MPLEMSAIYRMSAIYSLMSVFEDRNVTQMLNSVYKSSPELGGKLVVTTLTSHNF